MADNYIVLPGDLTGKKLKTISAVDSDDGIKKEKLVVGLEALDIEIGQVELKDADSDVQANIKAANTARTTATVVLATQPIDAAGKVLGKDAANTARTVATLVTPVQQVAADGVVDKLTTVTTVATVSALTGGGVAANATDSGNPVKVGGKYNASAPTLGDGDRGDLELDANGNTKTTLATQIAGEDLTNDVLKVEQRYSHHYQAAAAANVVVKAAAGFLHKIIIGAWVTNGVIEVSDHASDGDGNIMLKITAAATNIDGFPKEIEVNASMVAGITADIVGFTDVTFIYR